MSPSPSEPCGGHEGRKCAVASRRTWHHGANGVLQPAPRLAASTLRMAPAGRVAARPAVAQRADGLGLLGRCLPAPRRGPSGSLRRHIAIPLEGRSLRLPEQARRGRDHRPPHPDAAGPAELGSQLGTFRTERLVRIVIIERRVRLVITQRLAGFALQHLAGIVVLGHFPHRWG